DEGAIQVTLELPSGTSLERTSAVAAAAEERIATIPDVESRLTTVCGGGDFLSIGGGANIAQILVTLHEEGRPAEVVLQELRPLLADLPDTEVTALAIDPSSIGGAQAPIQVQISGPDYTLLQQFAAETEAALAATPVLT